MGKRIPKKSLIHESCTMENVQLGNYVEIGENNYLENVIIGDFSYTGPFSILQNIEIKNFSNIAAFTRFGPTGHPMHRPTQHHFTYRRKMYGLDTKDDEEFFNFRRTQKIVLGNDTWVGHGAIIMPNVTIGNGAVIGSGAVVTKDVSPYQIVVGVPAKLIKERFNEDIQEKLEKISWWNWPYEIIKTRIDDFSLSIDNFIEKYLQA